MGARLSRDDWRRENVNRFVERVHDSIKAAKPWVKFGISPFGIWRPGNPPQIKGLDAYGRALRRFAQMAGQRLGRLFHPATLLAHRYRRSKVSPRCCNGGRSRTSKAAASGRALIPPKSATNRWKPDEIANQIWLTRKQSGDAGAIFWGMKNLANNRALANTLAQNIYVQPALIPASP